MFLLLSPIVFVRGETSQFLPVPLYVPDTIFAKPVHEPDQAAHVNKDHDVYASWMINKIHAGNEDYT